MPDFATPDRDALRDAVTEALRENREWLRELVQEALLEVAVAEAKRAADLRAHEAEQRGAFPATRGQA